MTEKKIIFTALTIVILLYSNNLKQNQICTNKKGHLLFGASNSVKALSVTLQCVFVCGWVM